MVNLAMVGRKRVRPAAGSASRPVGPAKYFYHETSAPLPYIAAPKPGKRRDDKGLSHDDR